MNFYNLLAYLLQNNANMFGNSYVLPMYQHLDYCINKTVRSRADKVSGLKDNNNYLVIGILAAISSIHQPNFGLNCKNKAEGKTIVKKKTKHAILNDTCRKSAPSHCCDNSSIITAYKAIVSPNKVSDYIFRSGTQPRGEVFRRAFRISW